MKKLRKFLLLSVLLLALAEFSLLASPPAWAKSLVLIGGGLEPVLESCPKDPSPGDPGLVHTQAIYQKMIELAGGPGVAKIGVITAASGSPRNDPKAGDRCEADNYRDNGKYYVKAFKKLGAAEALRIPIDLDHISNKNSPEVVGQVRNLTGFFFGGGHQSRLIASFLNEDHTDSPVLAAIRQSYDQGAAILGTSAGTAIQAGGDYVRDSRLKLPMITGGESYEALRDKNLCEQDWEALSDEDYCRDRDDLSYYPEGGFGFFKYGLLDTYFAERGRQGRLVRLAWHNWIDEAYAPDENTALVVTDVDTPKVKMSVVGQGGVNIFDSPDNHDDNYERENPRELLEVAEDLFDSRSPSTYGETYEDDPIFEVTLTKDQSSGSTGYYGTQDEEEFYSFKNLLLDFVAE